MKRVELPISYLALIIIALLVIILVIIFVYRGFIPISVSQQTLVNSSNTELNNTFNNISSIISK